MLRLLGTGLLLCAGAGCGWAAAAHVGAKRQQCYTFARLLQQLAELLEVQALVGPELLRRAARSPEFAAFCPAGAAALSALQPPEHLPSALHAEIRQTLQMAEESPRLTACAALRRLATLCERETALLDEQYRAANRLWPKLGACLGAMTAILLW